MGRRQDDVIGDDGAAADVLVVHFAADDSLQKVLMDILYCEIVWKLLKWIFRSAKCQMCRFNCRQTVMFLKYKVQMTLLVIVIFNCNLPL